VARWRHWKSPEVELPFPQGAATGFGAGIPRDFVHLQQIQDPGFVRSPFSI